MLRDLFLGAPILSLAAFGLLHPWIGILGWTWLSIMNPHSYSWRLATMPLAALMAGATLIGLLLTKDRREFYFSRESLVLFLFMVWMCITLPFSFHFDPSFALWARVMKIDFMILVALVVLHSKRHILALAWVLVGSIGFYGVKGGLFTIATGGSYRVWGPTGSYVEGNNEIALALVITIPLIRFIQLSYSNIWFRRACSVSMALCAVAAIGSHSRGALLAIAAMSLVMWWRSDKKIFGLFVILAGVFGLTFMPDEWWSRMNTIKTYEQDTSAGGRINAWWMAWNLAKANIFGGGFMVYKFDVFARYAPDPLDLHAAHSIYFMVLGEHGFIGLFLFLLMWFLTWASAGRLRVQAKNQPETIWLSNLGAMCQVSLAGYAVGGAFLSLSYYDLPYNVMVLVILGCRWMDKKEWVTEQVIQAKADLVPKKKSLLAIGGAR
jgi:putative inorganic carbon (hco3(-)) transporter